MTTVGIQYLAHKEQQRANMAQEKLKSEAQAESRRHNIAMEDFNYASLDETRRHNMTLEDYSFQSLAETARHNKETEQIQWFNANTQQQILQETKRSNLAREQETNRSNIARETETNRSNVANETLTTARNENEAMVRWSSLLPSNMEYSQAMRYTGRNTFGDSVATGLGGALDFISSGINRIMGTSLR